MKKCMECIDEFQLESNLLRFALKLECIDELHAYVLFNNILISQSLILHLLQCTQLLYLPINKLYDTTYPSLTQNIIAICHKHTWNMLSNQQSIKSYVLFGESFQLTLNSQKQQKQNAATKY